MIEITDEMKTALELINNGVPIIYITGKAGTGKTTFLHHIKKTIDKELIVTAPTGVAAINAGGVTLHSMFNIPFGPINPNETIKTGMREEKIDLLKSIDVLVIDEVSMVRPDVMDFVDKRLRSCRNSIEPFGGVQIILFGDLFQLPPVVKDDEKSIVLRFYNGFYFFYANVFTNSSIQVIELNKIFRQSDERFIRLLNNIREYNIGDIDLDDLETLRNKFVSGNFEGKHIHICTHRVDVATINKKMLGKHTHTFYANVSGDFPINSAPCDGKLELRVGARVMILVNDSKQRYCNGSLGNVEKISNISIFVKLDSGDVVDIMKYKWKNYEYKYKDGKIVEEEKGSCSQFPITLAWAITIHKSQGLTFDNVVIHTKQVFCSGQIYVALSRCRTLDGIVSDSFIGKQHIIPDYDLIKFEQTYKRNNNKFNLMST